MILIRTWVTEISDKDINQSIVVHVGKTRADRVSTDRVLDSACIWNYRASIASGTEFFGDVVKFTASIINP